MPRPPRRSRSVTSPVIATSALTGLRVSVDTSAVTMAMPALAGLLLALTYIGGELAQLTMNLPATTVQVFQGMLLFFLLGFDLLTRYRIRRRRA